MGVDTVGRHPQGYLTLINTLCVCSLLEGVFSPVAMGGSTLLGGCHHGRWMFLWLATWETSFARHSTYRMCISR